MNRFLFCVAFLLIMLGSSRVLAMTSTNFQINWDNMNAGGDELATSTNFGIWDTLSDNLSGTSTSENFGLSAGYRAPDEDEILSFDVRSQDTASAVSYSAFNNVANTVTVSSAAGFAVGDYIGVVENTGFSELTAVGRITDITGTTITVDDFDGDGAGMSAVPAGGDDFVYRMSTNAIGFGTVAVGNENVALAMTSVLTSVPSGYSVYIQPNQNLMSATYVMSAVTDGSVSVGSEEYGAETVGATAVGAGSDLGVTTTQRTVQTSATDSGSIADRIGMIYKLSIDGSTPSGTYTQTVFYTLTANF